MKTTCPTAERLLSQFDNLHLLIEEKGKKISGVMVEGLSVLQKKILSILELPEEIYDPSFKYTESKTGKIWHRTLKGEDFVQLILQHVLPKGFRRVRDFGFLHGNAKKLLQLVQLILHVGLNATTHRPRPVFKCPCCKSSMVILGFRCTVWNPG